MTDEQVTRIEIETPIGKICAKTSSRYALRSAVYRRGYVMATDGKIAGVRQTGDGTDCPDETLIPAKAATPGTATRQGDTWVTQLGNRNPRATADNYEDETTKFPPLHDVINEANGTTRWFSVNIDLLTDLMAAITGRDEEGNKAVTIGIAEDTNKPAYIITDDARGIGLIMPRQKAHRGREGNCTTSSAWNQARDAFIAASKS